MHATTTWSTLKAEEASSDDPPSHSLLEGLYKTATINLPRRTQVSDNQKRTALAPLAKECMLLDHSVGMAGGQTNRSYFLATKLSSEPLHKGLSTCFLSSLDYLALTMRARSSIANIVSIFGVVRRPSNNGRYE